MSAIFPDYTPQGTRSLIVPGLPDSVRLSEQLAPGILLSLFSQDWDSSVHCMPSFLDGC